jgi:hypothetical protein
MLLHSGTKVSDKYKASSGEQFRIRPYASGQSNVPLVVSVVASKDSEGRIWRIAQWRVHENRIAADRPLPRTVFVRRNQQGLPVLPKGQYVFSCVYILAPGKRKGLRPEDPEYLQYSYASCATWKSRVVRQHWNYNKLIDYCTSMRGTASPPIEFSVESEYATEAFPVAEGDGKPQYVFVRYGKDGTPVFMHTPRVPTASEKLIDDLVSKQYKAMRSGGEHEATSGRVGSASRTPYILRTNPGFVTDTHSFVTSKSAMTMSERLTKTLIEQRSRSGGTGESFLSALEAMRKPDKQLNAIVPKSYPQAVLAQAYYNRRQPPAMSMNMDGLTKGEFDPASSFDVPGPDADPDADPAVGPAADSDSAAGPVAGPAADSDADSDSASVPIIPRAERSVASSARSLGGHRRGWGLLGRSSLTDDSSSESDGPDWSLFRTMHLASRRKHR